MHAAWSRALAGTALAVLAGAPAPAELEESTRIDVVEAWPVVVRPRSDADAERCAALGPGDVRVLEAGVPVDVVAVAQAPPLLLHVLMIDSSSSMTDPNYRTTRRKGRHAKTAARQYVDWMRADATHSPDERLMVVTFDNDLVMALPPTSVGSETEARDAATRIDSIPAGLGTALNDSLARLVRYLEGYEGQVALLLLSDGEDHGSMLDATGAKSLVDHANGITVFPIGIGTLAKPHEEFLKELGHLSGGQYFRLRGAAPDLMQDALIDRFREIRRVLRSRLYVSWRTARPGEMEDDSQHTDADGRVRRTVRIESLDRRCEISRDGYRSSRVLEPSPERAPEASPAAGGEALELTLELRDLVLDPDPLIRREGQAPGPSWKDRSVQFRLRPAPETRTSPERVLFDWLVDGVLPAPDLIGGGPLPREINGSAFLDLRRLLAGIVFANSASHRERAAARAGERMRAEIQRKVPPPQDAEGAERYGRQLELAVRTRLGTLTPDDYVNDIARWLEDVPARALALRLEALVTNRLLEGGEGAVREADLVQERWPRLHAWLPFPDRVRVVAPLEVLCDPAPDGPCGFFRIVMPRLSSLPKNWERSSGKELEPASFSEFVRYERAATPKHPFGLIFARWLLAREPLAGLLRHTGQVVRVQYEPVAPVASATCPASCRRRVVLELAGGARIAGVVRADGTATPSDPATPCPTDWCEEQDTLSHVDVECLDLHGPESWSGARLHSGLPPCGGR